MTIGVRQLDPGVLEIVIHEGRKHQVRRMCETVGHPVVSLQRVAFGPLRLGTLVGLRWLTGRAPEIDRDALWIGTETAGLDRLELAGPKSGPALDASGTIHPASRRYR